SRFGRRGGRRANRHRGSVAAASTGPASTAILSQVQPRRLPHDVHGPDFEYAAALEGKRVCGDRYRPARVDGERGGAGNGFRLSEIRGARAGGSEQAGG